MTTLAGIDLGAPLTETPDPPGAFPRLTDELYTQGGRPSGFFVIPSGKVAVTEGTGDDAKVVRVHGPRRFLGELGLLEGQPAFVGAVTAEPGEVLAIPMSTVRHLVLGDPVLGDLILRAYLVRRTVLVGAGNGLRIVVDQDPQAEALLERFGVAVADTPVVVLNGTEVLRNPSTTELAGTIGLRPPEPGRDVRDLLVVGAGPGGLAAVVHGASDGLRLSASDAIAPGGQAGTTSRIENHLGFPAGISGAEPAERSVIQAAEFGARIAVPAEARTLEARNGGYAVGFDDGIEIVSRAVVIATGARYRRLAVPGIETFEATSVYYAATPHEARRCLAAPVAVVGGGDLAANMSRYLVDQVEQHPRTTVLGHTEGRELAGSDLESRVVRLRRGFPAHRLAFGGGRSRRGRVRAHRGERRTVPGVFAVGDVRRGSVKRVASAVGEGPMAARFVHEHLSQEA
ncbi:FAD-dependent oxidoreductase [Amycolatopsis sp., V23-08]|uniref:FAD-dependent oxidoreductase n=1 Tax=Amycolatopsis heterodermiae TaxID=3110235 RepID=A0ABU5RJG9_9PSEU|nr:FAD-dependent oxidoreductase [Amycolatopsis sp., V23-08]MEA5365286.1 FAD-dependent oxidoreductase [Amycolatopsis sp., V23-08]